MYLLLQAGCKLNIRAKSNGETALHRAAANGRFKVVELLVNYGCKTLIKDNSGQIPLQLANMCVQLNALVNLLFCPTLLLGPLFDNYFCFEQV